MKAVLISDSRNGIRDIWKLVRIQLRRFLQVSPMESGAAKVLSDIAELQVRVQASKSMKVSETPAHWCFFDRDCVFAPDRKVIVMIAVLKLDK